MKISQQVSAFVGVVSVSAAGFANAALDPSIAKEFTTAQADALSLSGLAVPVILAVAALFIMPRLAKRFMRTL